MATNSRKKPEYTEEEKEAYMEELRQLLPRGTEILVVLKYVGREDNRYSFIVSHENRPIVLDYKLKGAGLIDHKQSRNTPNGIVTNYVSGIINHLGHTFHQDGNAFKFHEVM